MNLDTAGISKEEAAERQLEAAFFLLINQFSPEPIHTLIAAARGILYGLANHSPNKILEKWDREVLARVVGANTRDMRNYQNRVANFLKHADRDPFERLTGINLNLLNETELQQCLIALTVCTGENPSKRLNWALWYLGLSPNAIIPFNLIAKEYLGPVTQADIARMRDKGAFRDALQKLYLSQHC